ANYLAAAVENQTLNVTPATLHITAVSTNRPAGQTNPVFAVTYSNLVAGDTPASLASPAVVTTTADETSAAGTYDLEVNGAESDNYAITFHNGVLTVTKADPAISWNLAGANTITYGTALGSSQLSATAPVAGTFSYSPGSGTLLPAGTNPVVVTFTPTDGNSYETVSVTNNIIVNKATVLVAANAQTKYAGQSDPELTFTALGLVGGDTLTGALERPIGETPGTYAITQGTLAVAGAAAGNYTIQFTSANLTILVDSLALISAYDGSQTGSAIPALSNYTDLGITGVTTGNLLTINTAIARLDAAVTDSVEEIQAVVNAFGQILAGADGNASTPVGGLNLDVAIYQTVGVVLGDIATNPNNLFLYNNIISGRSVADVDSVQELDTLADVVNRLQDYAAGNPPATVISAGDLGLIGVSLSGLTNLTGDLAPFYSALEATADDGSGILTVAAVQALLTSYEKILAEANGASADTTVQDPLPSDYLTIGVNLGTIANVGYGLDLLNDLVAGSAKAAVDSVPELNALANVIDRILITAAGRTASPALTDADFSAIGITGVTSDNLSAVLAALAGTADNGEDIASISALQGVVTGATDALGKISQYDSGDTGADVPTAATYLAAGVTGVDATNLDAINTALAGLSPSDSDTRQEVQAAVDAYVKILGEANGGVADTTPSVNPTTGDYAAIGVNLGASASSASGLGLLNEVIGGKTRTDVDTVTELQGLADVIGKILATVAGTPPSPALTESELASLGLTGVTTNNLNDILAALAATDDSGSGAATVAQLQTLVDGVNSTYATNALAVISAYQPPTVMVAPTVSDYAEAGVSGVNLANLATFNSAMAVLGSSATDTTSEIQAVINTYFKILAEANGAAADPDPSGNPTVADYQTIGVTLDGLAGSLSGFSLFSDVVGASDYEDIDTVPELDALASVANRLLTVAGGGVANPALTAADLALIGINGVTSGNLADVLLAVGATPDDGSGISTVADLQAELRGQHKALWQIVVAIVEVDRAALAGGHVSASQSSLMRRSIHLTRPCFAVFREFSRRWSRVMPGFLPRPTVSSPMPSPTATPRRMIIWPWEFPWAPPRSTRTDWTC
ncbi:MAG: hypothetical protein EBS47_11980, partial [Betaproteobacteria bacterium]|nr:hypothetical protein [Betaproteobacteria bacterium]